MSLPAEKAAAIGHIGMAFSWAIFTTWMVKEVYSGMSGEEFVWMVVFPVPVIVSMVALGSLTFALALSLHIKRVGVKLVLISIAAGLQVYSPGWVAELDFSNSGTSSAIKPFWAGSICIWLIAIASHAYIATQPRSAENEENRGFD